MRKKHTDFSIWLDAIRITVSTIKKMLKNKFLFKYQTFVVVFFFKSNNNELSCAYRQSCVNTLKKNLFTQSEKKYRQYIS